MGGETHPIPSHGSKRRSNPIQWVKNFLQSVPWDGMRWGYPIPCGALRATDHRRTNKSKNTD